MDLGFNKMLEKQNVGKTKCWSMSPCTPPKSAPDSITITNAH